MNNNVKGRVIKIVSQVMAVSASKITEESRPDTIEAWDSLKHMNLILALEEEFGVQFSDEQIVEMLNVRLIIENVSELLSPT